MRSRATADDTYYSSDSAESGEGDDGRINWARYRGAQIGGGLGRRSDFARAVAELTGVLQVSEFSSTSHQLQAALLADIDTAVESCSRYGSPWKPLVMRMRSMHTESMLHRAQLAQIICHWLHGD